MSDSVEKDADVTAPEGLASKPLMMIPATILHPACGRCRFVTSDGRELVCRRNPPQVTILLVPAPPPRAGQLVPQVLAAFPIVHKDMWCGCFELAAGKMN